MLQVNVLVLFSVLSAKTTKIVLIVSVSVVLGVEMEFFDQSQMQDLPFMFHEYNRAQSMLILSKA